MKRVALLGLIIVSLFTLFILARHSGNTSSEENSTNRRLIPLQKLHLYAHSRGAYKVPVLQINGYIVIRIHGGFHEIRCLICDVAVARLRNATLIILEFRSKGISEEQTILLSAKDVRVLKANPNNIRWARGKKAIPLFKVTYIISSDFYLHYVLPSLEKHSVIELVVTGGRWFQISIFCGALRYTSDIVIYVSGVNGRGGRKMLIPLHAMFDNVLDRTSLRNFRELTGIGTSNQPLLNEGKRKRMAWETLVPCPRPLALPCAWPKYPYDMEDCGVWLAEKGDETESILANLRCNVQQLLQEAIDYVISIKTNLFIPGFDLFASLVVGQRLYQSRASKTYKPESPLAPALYVFGDSLSDSGNNNFLQTEAKVNYQPYGIDFPSGVTGRFTNGKTFVDFIAQLLGLPYAPPYLGLSVTDKMNTATGVNYASGSAGILPESGTVQGENLSFEKQIKYFHDTVTNDLPKILTTPAELSKYLSNSILVVSIGNNDYINNYLLPANYNSSQLYAPQQFADLLLDKLSQGLSKLYSLGARKFLVFNIGRIGCIPNIVNSINPKPTTPCVEDINNLVLLFNTRLPSMIKQLEGSLAGSTFVHGDSYGATQSSFKSGSISAQTPCCEIGSGGLCVADQIPCQDRAAYTFWDAFHPTEAVYDRLARDCFNGSSSCVPINVQQLAQKQ